MKLSALSAILALGMGNIPFEHTPSRYRIGSHKRSNGIRYKSTPSNASPRRDGRRNKGYAAHGNGRKRD